MIYFIDTYLVINDWITWVVSKIKTVDNDVVVVPLRVMGIFQEYAQLYKV